MENGANSTLFIAKVRKTDTGNYTCSIGPNDFYTINVQVLNGNLHFPFCWLCFRLWFWFWFRFLIFIVFNSDVNKKLYRIQNSWLLILICVLVCTRVSCVYFFTIFHFNLKISFSLIQFINHYYLNIAHRQYNKLWLSVCCLVFNFISFRWKSSWIISRK